MNPFRFAAFRAAVVTAVLALAGGLALLPAAPARAAAPLAKVQAPGYYRLKVGDFEVTALNDGTVALPVDKLLTNTSPENVENLLSRSFLKAPVETSVNGFLVNTGSRLVLIDSGAGTLFGPTVGRLVANLRAAGYTPEQVDEIYITHMHSDHIGGLAVDGKAVFPKAVVRADQRESGFWLDAKNQAQAAEDRKAGFSAAMSILKPYIDSGRFKPFDGATQLMPGVRAIPAYGHTPGHTVYEIDSQGARMRFLGDTAHVAAVQFPQPAVTVRFDSDSALAGPWRAQAFADAAADGYLIAFAHVSFPGIGRLRSEGDGYAWVPVNYASAPWAP